MTHPTIRLIQNPWRETVSDDTVRQALQTAANNVDITLQSLIDDGSVEGDGSYALVILDPTCPRWQQTITSRVMAIVLFGENAAQHIAGAAAKADAHDRHGQPNGELIAAANYRLGDGDSAAGHSIEFGGGCGLGANQDCNMATWVIRDFFAAIHRARAFWFRQREPQLESQLWWNSDNEPGKEYQAVAHLVDLV